MKKQVKKIGEKKKERARNATSKSRGKAKTKTKKRSEKKSTKPAGILSQEKRNQNNTKEIFVRPRQRTATNKPARDSQNASQKVISAPREIKPQMEEKDRKEEIGGYKEKIPPDPVSEKSNLKKEDEGTQKPKKQQTLTSPPLQKRDILIDEKEKDRLLKKYKPELFIQGKQLKKIPLDSLIEIKDIDALPEKIKDEGVLQAILYLGKKYPSFLQKACVGKTFVSENEFLRQIKDETVKLFLSEVDSLKGRVSGLRKKGMDVSYSDFQIMSIPLKIKMVMASFELKDLETVDRMLNRASLEIDAAEKSFFEDRKPAD